MAFTSTEIAHMADVQEEVMQDSCEIGVYSLSVDSAGGPTPVYTYGAEIPCGVNPHPGGMRRFFFDAEGRYAFDDLTIRLPLGTAVDFPDKLRVTKRYGVAVTNVDYSMIAPPEVGISCIVCNVRKAVT